MLNIKLCTPKELSLQQKKELEKLVQIIPIKNYRETLQEKVSLIIYGTNNKQEIVTCLFLTNDNEIIFYRTKPSLQGKGYGSCILLLALYSYKELILTTANTKVISFLVKNGFTIVEENIISEYSGRLSTKLIKL